MTKHAYEHLEGTPLWRVLECAVADLVENNDIEETTHRRYIVGYIAKKLLDKKLVDRRMGQQVSKANTRKAN